MSGPEYEALLRRRRIWGVPPDAVEQIAADCERTQAELRARTRELEGQLTQALMQRDEVMETIPALRAQIAQLEQGNTKVVDRPEMMREEALRFVVDTWAEAQAIREQTRQENQKAEAAARAEIAAMRRALAAEQGRHEAEMQATRERFAAEIALLHDRRRKAIADLESLAENLLRQTTSIAALSLSDAEKIAPKPVPSPPAKPPSKEVVAESPALPPEPAFAMAQSTPAPAMTAPPPTNTVATEDQLLARALDDLEAILSVSRKTNGTR
jgi:hypothetical protein